MGAFTTVAPWCRVLAVAVFAVMASPLSAAGPGDAEAGRRIAEAWCANCHLVGAGQTTATSNGAPTFPAIAGSVAMTQPKLKAVLQTAHQRMPDLHLSGTNIDDVIAYIASLRPPRR